MNTKASSVREALIVELLGDVHELLNRVDALKVEMKAVTESGQNTAQSITDATNNYRATVDDSIARLRVETSQTIMQTTEHAAKSLVGQQTSVLQKAATNAIHSALTPQVLKKTKRDWLISAAVSGSCGGAVAALVLMVASRLT